MKRTPTILISGVAVGSYLGAVAADPANAADLEAPTPIFVATTSSVTAVTMYSINRMTDEEIRIEPAHDRLIKVEFGKPFRYLKV
jgi:hypothetical protein